LEIDNNYSVSVSAAKCAIGTAILVTIVAVLLECCDLPTVLE